MKLSIISIAKSDPSGLKRTLSSCKDLRALFKENCEHIIISSTPEMHREIIQNYPYELNVFEQTPIGVYPAINYGIKKAQFPIIWHLHAGDELANLQNFMRAYDKLSQSNDLIVYSPVYLKKPHDNDEILFDPREPFSEAVARGQVPHPGVLFRSEIFQIIGAFDESYKIAGDLDLFVRVINTKLSVQKSAYPFSRFYLDGLSSQEPYKTMEETRRALSHANFSFPKKFISLARATYGLWKAKLIQHSKKLTLSKETNSR